MTVRQILQALASGQINQAEAVGRLRSHTDWDPEPTATAAHKTGVLDIPLTGDNSRGQIDLVPGLTRKQRRALWAAVS